MAGTERSKETVEEVMKDVDAYLKTASQPIRDRLCWSIAGSLYHRSLQIDLETLAVGRKYLDQIKYLPDDQNGLPRMYEEKERLLKAKPPEKK